MTMLNFFDSGYSEKFEIYVEHRQTMTLFIIIIKFLSTYLLFLILHTISKFIASEKKSDFTHSCVARKFNIRFFFFFENYLIVIEI